MQAKESRKNNFTFALRCTWRTHSCVPRPQSCGRLLFQTSEASRKVSVQSTRRRCTQECVRHDRRCEIVFVRSLRLLERRHRAKTQIADAKTQSDSTGRSDRF